MRNKPHHQDTDDVFNAGGVSMQMHLLKYGNTKYMAPIRYHQVPATPSNPKFCAA